MGLPDAASSRVVLLGTAHYPNDDALEDLDAVTSNLVELRKLLCDSTVSTLSREHCQIVHDPETPVDLAMPVQQACAQAEDLLFIYYAGHGLLDNRMALHLGVKRSTRTYTRFDSFDYEGLRELLALSRARKKVLILDCCFSGRAIGTMATEADIAAADLDAAGTYILTATSATKPAHAPVGYEFTAFTNELLAVLRGGIESGPELLGLDDVYRALRTRLLAEGLPEPQRRTTNASTGLALARNLAWSQQTADAQTEHDDRHAQQSEEIHTVSESAPAPSVPSDDSTRAQKERTPLCSVADTPGATRLKESHARVWAAFERAIALDDLQAMIASLTPDASDARERLARGILGILNEPDNEIAEQDAAVAAAAREATASRTAAVRQVIGERYSVTHESLVRIDAGIEQLQTRQDHQTAIETSVRHEIDNLGRERDFLRTDISTALANDASLKPPDRRRLVPRRIAPEQRRVDEMGATITRLEKQRRLELEKLQRVKSSIREVVTAKKRAQLEAQKVEQQLVKLETQGRMAVASDPSRFPDVVSAEQALAAASRRLDDLIAEEVAVRANLWLRE